MKKILKLFLMLWSLQPIFFAVANDNSLPFSLKKICFAQNQISIVFKENFYKHMSLNGKYVRDTKVEPNKVIFIKNETDIVFYKRDNSLQITHLNNIVLVNHQDLKGLKPFANLCYLFSNKGHF